MQPKFIFDLSEVLIMGLVGIEKPLSHLLDMPENEILPGFAGELLQKICRGEISEDYYLQEIVAKQNWQIEIEQLKRIIRENFHQEVEGTKEILSKLADKNEVILLSDHAREWVATIKEIHSLFELFNTVFFSYELGGTKKEPQTFRKVLQQMNYRAQECWLIDDSATNIKVAASVGINGIQFTNAKQLQDTLVHQLLI